MNRTNWTDLLYTDAPAWSILVRLLVGLVVFLPERIQKLIFPDILGAGRFARIGIPFPDVMGPFVGVVETVCGALIIVGLFTRLAVIPLIIIMIVALISTSTKRGPISQCCSAVSTSSLSGPGAGHWMRSFNVRRHNRITAFR